jgi:hypothetical protein
MSQLGRSETDRHSAARQVNLQLRTHSQQSLRGSKVPEPEMTDHHFHPRDNSCSVLTRAVRGTSRRGGSCEYRGACRWQDSFAPSDEGRHHAE